MIASQQIQVSTRVSPETRRMMDEYVRAGGEKEAILIETALLHHLQALTELPEYMIVPPRILVSEDSGRMIMESLDNPPEPTDAMKSLFNNEGHEEND
ncbi:MAG TPA: hypothetical protein ENK58_08385 [Desulfobacterales bacterium]|nr:hypothetical protein [Desulfobacterales bacterium]